MIRVIETRYTRYDWGIVMSSTECYNSTPSVRKSYYGPSYEVTRPCPYAHGCECHIPMGDKRCPLRSKDLIIEF